MKNKVAVKNDDFLDLVGDGAIADSKTADGRLIPVMILDTREKKQLEYLVKMHNQIDTGDVTSIWGVARFNISKVNLVLFFKKPVELKVAISLHSLKHASLIQGILISKAVYIQPGVPGDRISHNINAPKILVEIPTKTTFEKWDEIFEKSVIKKFKKEGLRGKNLKDASLEHISLIKDIWGKRLNNANKK
ncbi:hypothetical protein LH671_12325 [Enterobacter kobei]|uniref:hypothetical protein n=2 Tax=Enterobacter cloacae complex TaxID=354276 RepID=UPI001F3C9AA0|nr:hypothetical protein [Enterobacter kobei]MCF1328719.1 hypothetical protein [Enterobacter kobei]HDC4519065.1 hypothetical protein [Enterobacter kobei]